MLCAESPTGFAVGAPPEVRKDIAAVCFRDLQEFLSPKISGELPGANENSKVTGDCMRGDQKALELNSQSFLIRDDMVTIRQLMVTSFKQVLFHIYANFLEFSNYWHSSFGITDSAHGMFILLL